MNYEINDDTLAVLSFDKNSSMVLENGDEYIVDDIPYNIMENSCKYFGSSLEGRILGSKNILGSIYKVPIIIEESQGIVFFPTAATDSSNVSWISYNNIRNIVKCDKKTKVIFKNDDTILLDCPYFTIKNQIFRCNMLLSITNNRKKSSRNGSIKIFDKE